MADEQISTEQESQLNSEEMQIVTMVDVLKEEQELEEDAKAVLGGSDEKNCTYSKGYLKRQALYACLTCIPEAKDDPSKRAGICLACSYHCHEGHALIELYTKRNFCCDCGNGLFPSNCCKLEPNKSSLNEGNTYNHNFCGLYCTCERPYPDPEDNIADDMIQCIICEDWYHCRHLGVDIPALSSYSEMTCRDCVCKHDFLLNYSGLAITRVFGSNVDKNITIKEEMILEKTDDDKIEKEPSVSELEVCKMPLTKMEKKSAKFWPENWRLQLCTCAKCLEMYEKQKVSYLVDLQDTVHAYEEKGKAKAQESSSESQYELGMKALSSLGRVQQLEAISEYNTMMDHLKAYLQKFAENKKVVREEDIREFFTEMTAKKKRKVEVPYFCR